MGRYQFNIKLIDIQIITDNTTLILFEVHNNSNIL